jgi:hypothetical protein
MERVARSLLVLQAAFGLTATLGMVLLSGPVHAVAPGLYAAWLLVLAARIHRRWSLYTVVIVEGLALAGFQLEQTLALLPQLDATLTLTGMLTTVALPAVVVLLAARLTIRGGTG